LTDEEMKGAVKEMIELHKNDKQIRPKSRAFAQGIIDVLNNPAIPD
jgi:hypothetical protein